jgi:hypothetical protein
MRAKMSDFFEQQSKESSKAFAAFSLYLSLGEQRSLEAVGQKLGKSKVLMERWSKRYQWVDLSLQTLGISGHVHYLFGY